MTKPIITIEHCTKQMYRDICNGIHPYFPKAPATRRAIDRQYRHRWHKGEWPTGMEWTEEWDLITLIIKT